jgi:hypothetical protein
VLDCDEVVLEVNFSSHGERVTLGRRSLTPGIWCIVNDV